MKISQRTLSILKNFSMINKSILIRPGNTFVAVDKITNIIGRAKVEEVFPVEFAIYDLHHFLQAISLIDSPKFEFYEKYVEISDNIRKINYSYCDSRLLADNTVNNFDNYKNHEVLSSFKLSFENLKDLLKASSTLDANIINFIKTNNNENLKAVLYHDDEMKRDTYSVYLESNNVNQLVNCKFKCESIRILPDNYAVNILRVKDCTYGHFSNENDLSYFILSLID